MKAICNQAWVVEKVAVIGKRSWEQSTTIQLLAQGDVSLTIHRRSKRRPRPPAYNANAGRSDYDTLGTGHRLRGLPAARTR